MNVQKLTQKSAEAIQNAQRMAVEYGNSQVEQEHLIAALTSEPDSLCAQLLAKMGVDAQAFGREVRGAVERLPKVSGGGREQDKIYIAREVDNALNEAEAQAERMHDEYVSVEHLMLGLITKPSMETRALLARFNIAEQGFLAALKEIRGSARVTSDTPEDTYDALKKYGQDLVERARAQKLDPVIGRDGEIRNVIRILSRKTKNNPCLIGEPGVGKTAIVEGLALRIVRGDVPAGLKDRRIFALDMGALVAGAKFRGEFEDRKSVV